MNLVQLAPRELLHQLEQLDFAVVVADGDHLGARRLERRDFPFLVHRAHDQRLAFLQQARGRGRLEFRIDDDLERLPGRIDAAHVELRVVVPDGAEASQERAGARPPAMPVLPRCFSGDPLALAVGERGAPVEAHRDFHAHPRPAARHAGDEANVELARLVLHRPALDRNPCCAQLGEARTCDPRIRILNRRHHASDAGIDDRVSARRGAAVMAAWFQVHVEGCAARTRPGCLQCQRLRVRHPGALMPARADDRPVLDHDATDARIGCRRIEAAPGEFERLPHEFMVRGRDHYFSMRRARFVPGFFTSSIASRKSSTR